MVDIDNELLERAVRKDLKLLKPVLDASYSLKPLTELELLTIAKGINEKLGYDLFNDLYYPRLLNDFSLVSRTVAKVAIKEND